jgi:hypothetical protein
LLSSDTPAFRPELVLRVEGALETLKEDVILDSDVTPGSAGFSSFDLTLYPASGITSDLNINVSPVVVSDVFSSLSVPVSVAVSFTVGSGATVCLAAHPTNIKQIII